MEVRYTELANAIVKNITDGDVAIGSQLPSELAMAQQYGVSRTTIRSALNIVEGLGLVSRKRRAGTVVVSNTTAETYTKSLYNIEDLVHYASQTERKVMSIADVVADASLAMALECKPGQHWLKIQMLRTEKTDDHSPVCWTDAYLEPKIGYEVLSLIEDGSGLLSNIIEKQTGTSVFDVKQEIGATAISASIAAQLQTEAHAPVLEITRHYLDRAKQTFLITVMTYPPDKFKFTFWMHRATTVTL